VACSNPLYFQVDEIPVFHCAPRYPELSVAGFCQPVFGTMIANISMQNQPNNSNYKLDLVSKSLCIIVTRWSLKLNCLVERCIQT